MASIYVEEYPILEVEEEKKVLAVSSTGEFMPKLHWSLPHEYRPVEKSEIRYIYIVPPEEGLMVFMDRYSGETLFQKEIEEENYAEQLKEMLELIK